MKKTKTIEEYYCDFCGNECTDEHYDVTLPFTQSNGYSSRFCSGKPDDDSIVVHRLDLCGRCTRINAKASTFLSNACRHEVGVRQTVEKDHFNPVFNKVGTFAYPNNYPKEEHVLVLEYDE